MCRYCFVSHPFTFFLPFSLPVLEFLSWAVSHISYETYIRVVGVVRGFGTIGLGTKVTLMVFVMTLMVQLECLLM